MALKLRVLPAEIRLRCIAGTIQVTGKQYEGDYDVVPRVGDAVVLPTRDCLMAKDVTVEEIPIYEVSNLSGGNTLIIGVKQTNA